MIAEVAVEPGTGTLEFQRVGGRTVVTKSFAASPLKFINPKSNCEAAWVYAASYGGGLVGGDYLRLNLELGPGSVALLSTQASTKVYRSHARAGQRLSARVAAGATLIVAGDPVACFAGSNYEQEQEFELDADASLIAVDWMTGGRAACGERWAFDHYSSKTRVIRDARLALFDSLLLNPTHSSIVERMGRFNTFASVYMLGPSFANDSRKILEIVNAKPLDRYAEMLVVASPMMEGVVLRLAGVSAQQIGAMLQEFLEFLRPVVGDILWSRKM